jgi:hypothetical protein
LFDEDEVVDISAMAEQVQEPRGQRRKGTEAGVGGDDGGRGFGVRCGWLAG